MKAAASLHFAANQQQHHNHQPQSMHHQQLINPQPQRNNYNHQFNSSLQSSQNYAHSQLTQSQQQSAKRKRRHRTIFSEEQLDHLEQTFSKTHYPDVVLREDLASKIDLKEERVEVIIIN